MPADPDPRARPEPPARPLHRGVRRLLLAAALATGLAACVQAGGSTGMGIQLVSPETTRQLGLQAWQDVRAETPVSTNRARQAALQRVAGRVLQAAGQNPAAWEPVVFHDDEANAFALPGGKIGVYDGIFRYVRNDAQLAAVVAHEVAHDLRDHATERLNTATATQLGSQVVGAILQSQGLGDPDTVAGLLGLGAEYGVLLPYSRNQELEADRIGLILMARAGYDPREAITFWQAMQNAGARPPEFLSSHPAPGNRIAQLEQLMPEALANYRPR